MQQSFLEPSNLQRIVLTTLLLGTSLLVSCVMRSWQSFAHNRYIIYIPGPSKVQLILYVWYF